MKSINNEIITVDEMTAGVRDALLRAPRLSGFSVRGELLGFKLHTSGHAYFTLLGENTRVACVLFRSYAASVLAWPKDGDEVLVRGRIDVYGARGSYQIYATALLPLGAGAKARAKEMLRQRLEKEGLFDPRLKRPLPRFPERVAVITSPTGAALQDILKLHSLRFPCSELIVVPSLMQGADAAGDIIRAFARVRGIKGLSCVILARGGGNRDDLDIFDSEEVTRAVRLCPVPVITGLGHQIDSTLADLAADASAPTPTGAAERLFPDGNALDAALASARGKLATRISARISSAFSALTESLERLNRSVIKNKLTPAGDLLSSADERLNKDIRTMLKEADARIVSLSQRLEARSPLALLSKGYSICEDAGGRIVSSASGLSAGEKLKLLFKDGSADVSVCGTTLEKIHAEAG